MKVDQKGQISIEFVLIIGFMVILVLVFAGYIGNAMESNSVSAAARSGAMDAASNIVLNQSAEPLRVKDVQILGTGQNVTIQVKMDTTPSATAKLAIFNGTLHSVADLGYTIDTRDAMDPYDDVVVSSRHIYSITIV